MEDISFLLDPSTTNKKHLNLEGDLIDPMVLVLTSCLASSQLLKKLPSIGPSLTLVWWWRQQSWQRRPETSPVWHLKAFPGQPSVLGRSGGLLPVGRAPSASPGRRTQEMPEPPQLHAATSSKTETRRTSCRDRVNRKKPSTETYSQIAE